MVLAAVIILLAGAFVCACTGRLETTLQVRASAQDGTVTVSLPSTGRDARKEAVQAGMKLRRLQRLPPSVCRPSTIRSGKSS